MNSLGPPELLLAFILPIRDRVTQAQWAAGTRRIEIPHRLPSEGIENRTIPTLIPTRTILRAAAHPLGGALASVEKGVAVAEADTLASVVAGAGVITSLMIAIGAIAIAGGRRRALRGRSLKKKLLTIWRRKLRGR